MVFYKIRFHSFPTIKFASTVRTDKYKNIISHRKNILEIGTSHGTPIRIYSDKESIIRPSNSFITCTPDISYRAEATTADPLYMSFAAISGDFTAKKFDSDEIESISAFLDEVKEDILLPFIFPLDTNYTEIERLFRLLIMEYLKETAEGHLRAISLWFEITAYVSDIFKQSLLKNSSFNYGEYYSRKAKRYIEDHYHDKITVQDIATQLGITPNYLSRIFKTSTGKTLTEFIAITRLYHARQFAYDKELTFEEIARRVGICDIYYLNRLFHKYYGTSLYACRMTDHEISLFHDKPWDVDNLTEDIYKG